MHPILSVVASPLPIVSLADAKAHLRVESDDDDALITSLVAAATVGVDGATGWLGRALGQQTLALTGSHFPGARDLTDWRFGFVWPCYHPHEIRLPCPPVQAIEALNYVDADDVAQTLDPSAYRLVDRFLFPAGGAFWPATAWRPDAVTVTYVAGYPVGTVPAPIVAAIKLKLGALYTGRNDAVAPGAMASDALLMPFRVFG